MSRRTRRRVSHGNLLKSCPTRRSKCEKLSWRPTHGEWVRLARAPHPALGKSPLPGGVIARGLTLADRGRRLDHIWVSRASGRVSDFRMKKKKTRDARG